MNKTLILAILLLIFMIAIIVNIPYSTTSTPTLVNECEKLSPDGSESRNVYEQKAINYVRCLANG